MAGYSTETVAQHTFALLFYLMEHLPYYDTYVKSGKYMDDVLFTHFEKAFHELNGKTWGIIGMGTIGRTFRLPRHLLLHNRKKSAERL